MPTYQYECGSFGLKFERKQSIKEESIEVCPECLGKVSRLISGSSGFFIKASRGNQAESRGDGCTLTQTGRTCCSRGERYEKPPCGEES